MTLNAVIALILRFLRNSTDFQAGGWRYTYNVRKSLSPSTTVLLLAKNITHPAARSLCDSWVSCLLLPCANSFNVSWNIYYNYMMGQFLFFYWLQRCKHYPNRLISINRVSDKSILPPAWLCIFWLSWTIATAIYINALYKRAVLTRYAVALRDRVDQQTMNTRTHTRTLYTPCQHTMQSNYFLSCEQWLLIISIQVR